jgi:GTP cyclohydrolase IB
MADEKRFLVDVGMDGLPFPIKAASKADPAGQSTIATISVKARIMHEFEAEWIDRFIQVLHGHRDRIGTATLRENTLDYLKELNATAVRVDFEYPFFVEKKTPVSGEKCLVRYTCGYSVKVPSLDNKPKVFFKIKVPCITTFPKSGEDLPGGLFGQLSVVSLEVESLKDYFPEDAVALVDRHALAPVYSFLTQADQTAIIQKIHDQKKTSVVMVDEIKGELMADKSLDFYSVHCANFGMLHSYATAIRTEKSMWVPFSGYEDSEV